MAVKKPKIVTRRKVESVRERAEKQRLRNEKTPRRRKATDAAAKPAKGMRAFLSREYHPLRLPDNKAGKVLNKRKSLIPEYFSGSFAELKKVQWSTPRQAASLSFAVIIFSLSIAALVRALDFGFEKIVKEVILK